MPVELKGTCLCGEVAIEATAENSEVGACHCGMCLNWGGGPFLGVHCGNAVRLSGEANISVYASSEWAERGFCRVCGTHLFYRLKAANDYSIPVGIFSDFPNAKLVQQIFIDEKPAFYTFAEKTQNLTGQEAFAMFAESSE